MLKKILFMDQTIIKIIFFHSSSMYLLLINLNNNPFNLINYHGKSMGSLKIIKSALNNTNIFHFSGTLIHNTNYHENLLLH